MGQIFLVYFLIVIRDNKTHSALPPPVTSASIRSSPDCNPRQKWDTKEVDPLPLLTMLKIGYFPPLLVEKQTNKQTKKTRDIPNID